jgi:hypothetical protein
LFFTRIMSQDLGVPYNAVAFVYTLDHRYGLSDGLDARGTKTGIILQEELATEYLKGFDPRFWNGLTTRRIYSFGEDAAFSGQDLYRIEQGHIRIHPGRVPAEAKKTYGLTEGQTFLGAFDGRVFYWNAGQPQAVHFQSGTQVYRFKLPERVTEPLGMARGEPKGDLALYAEAKQAASLHMASRTCDWFILDLKDAERIR